MGRRSLSASGNISGNHKLDGRSVNKLKHMRISRTLSVVAARNGRPLHQSSVLRRKLHPVLAKLGQPKCGMHAFRRFRNTYLRSYTSTPPGVRKFWMGHAGEGMSDLYDKIRNDLPFRKEVAEKAGLGFELPFKKCIKPKQFWSKKCSIGTEWTEMDRNARCTIGCKCGIISQDNSRGVAQPG